MRIILNVSPETRKTKPLMPATPKPGMTKISRANNTNPEIKTKISQFSANPSRYNGAKKAIAAAIDTTIGTPNPGACNSSTIPPIISNIKIILSQGKESISNTLSNEVGFTVITSAFSNPFKVSISEIDATIPSQ